MDKKQSMAIKGVAIIMMVIYHLFYVAIQHGYEVNNLIYIGGISVLERLSEISYPVSLFVMITGYGLAFSYKKEHDTTYLPCKIFDCESIFRRGKKIIIKSLKLYVRLWLVYLMVLPVCCYLYPNIYPKSYSVLILNLLNIETSYNVSEWFLLPYIILIIVSSPLLKFIFRYNSIWTLITSLLMTGAYLLIYRKIGLDSLSDIITPLGMKIYLVISFILPFSLGAIANKHSLPERVYKAFEKYGGGNTKLLAITCILVLVAGRFVVHNQTLQPFAIFILFVLFPALKLSQFSMNILIFLGKHSLVIWFIHTWYSENLFSQQIYSLKNPIMIFIAVMCLSVISSLVIENICRKILK